ncbi:MAG: YraN family protein [Flammeovirgaceae bacterium TMED32]|nr:MAG: YraN family protein [Flammeovirgaceae bacterium TMED32]
MLENKVKGKLEEALAKKHLESVGIKIIEENYRYKRGEIDLIGISSNQLLVFIEVKYRKNDNFGNPEDFVSNRQKKNIIQTANAYIHQIHWKKDIRFDIISILVSDEAIIHLEDAR